MKHSPNFPAGHKAVNNSLGGRNRGIRMVAGGSAHNPLAAVGTGSLHKKNSNGIRVLTRMPIPGMNEHGKYDRQTGAPILLKNRRMASWRRMVSVPLSSVL